MEKPAVASQPVSMSIKNAWRHIVRHKTSSLINVFGLATGLCACIMIYLICSFEFSFDRFHPGGERTFRVTETIHLSANRTIFINNIPSPAPGLLKTRVPGFQKLTAFYPYWSKTTIRSPNAKPIQFDCHVPGSQLPGTILADTEYFNIFRYTWLAGNPSAEFEKPYRVVISEIRARTYFGNVNLQTLLGREIIYNDSIRATLVGIVKDWTENTDFPFTDFISMASVENHLLRNDFNAADWNGRSVTCFVQLPPGYSPSQSAPILSGFLKTFDVTDAQSHRELQLQPLSDIHFNGAFHGDDLRTAHKPTLYVLTGVAGLILLLAVVNFINLSSAQSLDRMKETGIRKVLGSPKWKITAQFMLEAGLLTTFSTILAVSCIPIVFHLFRSFVPGQLSGSFLTSARGFLIVAFILVTTLLCAIYPARLLASHETVSALKGVLSRPGSGIDLIRKSMIVFQFTISIIFISCALILHSQLKFIRSKDLGLNTEKVLMLSTGGPKGHTGIDLLDESVKRVPGILGTSREILPPVGEASFGLQILGRTKNRDPMNVVVRGGNERFIPFYKIHLLAGRNIQASDSLKELVINESFARVLGFEYPPDAIGQMLTTGQDNFPELSGRTLPIVGVVADFNIFSLHTSLQPVIIAHIPEVEDKLAVRLSGGSIKSTEATISRIGKVWKTLYPDGNFEYQFLDDSIAAMYEKETRTSTLLTAAVSLSIFVSCIGLFGMMTYAVRTRTREIGIRKLLGAPVAGLVFLLNRENLKLIGLALMIAVPVAGLIMSRWLQNFAFRISISPWHFIFSGVLTIFIAVLTVCSLAVKAATVNPVTSLRSE